MKPLTSSRRRDLRHLLLCTAATLAVGCHDVHLDFNAAGDGIVIFDDLYSISVVDEKRAVAVGYYGAVYTTEDGGESWRKGKTGTLTPIYDVAMADDRYGWAVGQSGMILRTEDGGQTWKRQPNLKETEGTHLFSVTALDRDNAWAVGSWGTRIRTRDGGANWTDHSFTIHEQHPQFVWLAPPDQEKVRNGEKVYDDVGLTDVSCNRPPSRRCWLIGEFGYIYYSDDQGETWKQSSIEGSIEVPLLEMGYNELELGESPRVRLKEFADAITDEEHLNVAIESFASEREIATFGNPDDPFELFEMLEARSQEARTVLEDAGILSDRLRMRSQPPWDFEDFLEDDPQFLERYLAGRKASAPGVGVRVLQNPYLYTVSFRDDQNGLIAGLGGVILLSRDGGETWSYRKIDRKQALFAASEVDGRAVAVGEKGLVRVSTDDGSSWLEPPQGTFPDIFTYMRDVNFDPSGRVGYIVGQRGQILRSTDAGFQWTQVLPRVESDSKT